MPSTLELATSGRARCRGCDQLIGKGELRLGERLPNPFADGEMVLWFHPTCGAFKRPAAMLEALAGADPALAGREAWEATATRGVAHRRLPRIDGVERAARSQAKCRSCREPIERGSWRIKLVYFEEGRFAKSGFVHLACAEAYFETKDVADAMLHFSPPLAAEERQALLDDLLS